MEINFYKGFSFIILFSYSICSNENYMSFKASLTDVYPAYDFIRDDPILQNQKYKIPLMSLYIGTPPVEYKFTISTELYLTWMGNSILNKTFHHSQLYCPDNSSTFIKMAKEEEEPLRVHYHSKMMFGSLVSDIMHIEDQNFNFTFVLVNQTDNFFVNRISGIIGIVKEYHGGSVYGNPNYNILNVLERSGTIAKRKFSFDFSNKNSSFHYITFGKTYKNMSYCDSNYRFLTLIWYCDLYGITFNNKKFPTGELLYFESSIPYITVSDKLGDVLFDEITTFNQHCYRRKSGKKMEFLICDGDFEGLLQNELLFHLGTIEVPVKIKDIAQEGFYDEDLSRGKYYLLKLFREIGGDSSTFGAIIFKNRIVTFDQDNHAIGFSKYYDYDINPPSVFINKIKKFILISNIIIEFTFTCSIIFNYYFYLKN